MKICRYLATAEEPPPLPVQTLPGGTWDTSVTKKKETGTHFMSQTKNH